MSLNKKLCFERNLINRQSFDDRVCDDLSEVILQYLSLEDRLRLECVSKQFQRTVFVKQRETNCFSDLIYEKPINKRIKLIETILKKCQNINKITLSETFGQMLGKDKYNEIIELIIKYCNNLSHLSIDFGLTSKTNQELIHQKYGSKLILTNPINVSKCIFKTLNVDKLTIPPLSHLTEYKFNSLNYLKILDSNHSEDLDQLEVFSEENKHLIKYLNLFCTQIEDNFISKFKNLVHLNLKYLFIGLTDNQFKQIADNCSQLKSIKCRLNVDPNIGPINDNLLSALKQIKSLKRLDISFNKKELKQISKVYIKKFSFKAFKGFEGLTHLSIDWPFNDSKGISETILTDIDINLPNLQFLNIISSDINASEWTADILCRLIKLQTIQLRIEESVQPIIKRRLEESIQIKTIEFGRKYMHW